jgi:hypothetical protein
MILLFLPCFLLTGVDPPNNNGQVGHHTMHTVGLGAQLSILRATYALSSVMPDGQRKGSMLTVKEGH